MLAGVWWLGPSFPDNVLFPKLVPFACTILWLVLSGLLLRRLGASRNEAIISASFAAASPWTLYLATNLLSDLPFAAVALGSLYLLERDPVIARASKWSRPVFVGLLAGLSFLTAARGITVWAAAVALFLARRQWRSALVASAAFGILAAPWIVWQSLNAAPTNPAYWYYSKLNYQTWHVFGDFSTAEAARVVFDNSIDCAAWPQLLWGISSTAVHPVVLQIVAWSLTLCALIGFVVTAWRDLRAVHFWTVLYLGMIVCWVFPPDRFLVPLMPLYLYFLIAGVKYLQRRRKPTPAGQALVWTFLVVSFATSVSQLVWDTSLAVREDSPTCFGQEPDNWPATMELMAWLQTETPEDAVVGSCLDPVVNLYSDRKAIRPFRVRPFALCYDQEVGTYPLGNVEEFRLHLLTNRVSYIHVSPMAWYLERPRFLSLIDEASRAHPGVFRVAKQASDARYFLLEVDLFRLAQENHVRTDNRNLECERHSRPAGAGRRLDLTGDP